MLHLKQESGSVSSISQRRSTLLAQSTNAMFNLIMKIVCHLQLLSIITSIHDIMRGLVSYYGECLMRFNIQTDVKNDAF